MAEQVVRRELGRNLTYGLQDLLGRAVVVGEFSDIPFPTEGEIVKRYGVSRSVTREAVKMLSAKGLLGARPRQGTFILPIEQWNLFDADVLRWLVEHKPTITLLRRFNEIRVVMEPQAASLAASRATQSQKDAISLGLARMQNAERGEDDPLDADIAFHVAVLRASGNPFIIQFRDVVATALRTSIRFTNRVAGRTASVEDHSRVHEAILAGDSPRAYDAMRALIDDVLHLIEEVAASDGSGPN